MKNMKTILPVIAIAGFFIYSCASSDKNYTQEAPKANGNSDYTRHADSTSVSSSSLYADQETGGNKNAAPSSSSNEGSAKDNTAVAQTEQNNNAYQSFLYLMNSTAARPTRLDSTHRFVRTAAIKFRAKNVATCSYRIEDLAVKFGGYVADTKLESQLQSSYEKPVSVDSSLQTMRFIVTNTIVLRVPVENLDTTLKSLVPMVDYLDYRNVNTNDITLDLLANKLAQIRILNYNHRLALDIDNKGKHLDDVQTAEQSILNQQENSDNALIENLRKDDQVKYSTVTIYLYQKETIRQELIAREKDVDEYEPGLGTKIWQALGSGWHGLQAIILGITILWPLWLVALGTWFFVRWMVKRSKKVK